MSFRVQLDSYSGPLDLLLYLVRRDEVDVRDIPIARITGQFLEFLEVLQIIDFDEVGDFVVLASSLVEIKSRLVLPGSEDEPEPVEVEGDPRADLVRQLLDYKRFKDAARLLDEQAAIWQERYPRLSDDRPRHGADPASDRIKEVELWDLVSAFSRILRRNVAVPQTTIVYDDTPISAYVERIRDRVQREKRVAFSSFFEGAHVRSKIVGLFLAILELMRHYSHRAEQPVEYGEIWILPPVEAAQVPSAEVNGLAETWTVPVDGDMTTLAE